MIVILSKIFRLDSPIGREFTKFTNLKHKRFDMGRKSIASKKYSDTKMVKLIMKIIIELKSTPIILNMSSIKYLPGFSVGVDGFLSPQPASPNDVPIRIIKITAKPLLLYFLIIVSNSSSVNPIEETKSESVLPFAFS